MRILATLFLLVLAGHAADAQRTQSSELSEITIAELHASFRAKRLTCVGVVEAYLKRIDAYDKRGPSINAIIQLNPNALAIAADLDRRYALSGPVGPLHCVTVAVKDNFETVDMPTTAGSLSLRGMNTAKDAVVVKRLRDAGAVMIGKTNMHEFAFSQYETVSSILPGYTRNPYDPRRVTAGSSGGTAASVAANFAAVGIGTDTGASIRGPASFQALVGIRPTMGMASRSGIVPVFLDSDVPGPLTRTVADAAAVLEVMAAPDPDDASTGGARPRQLEDYAGDLAANGLNGARIGVLGQIFDTPTMDAEVRQLFQGALSDLQKAGATVLNPVSIGNFDELRQMQRTVGRCNTFKFELNRYLLALGDKAPLNTLQQIIESRQFHPTIQARLETSQAADDVPGESPGCQARSEFRSQLRGAVAALMSANKLDALIYPTWSNPPRLIGDLNTPHGDNNQLLSPSTGFPAITVPMGFTNGNTLPAGLQFLGAAWAEPTLIRLAYAYEKATLHRRPPATTPD
jgi:Asp-tRNA(Asn)/Glu-tRNA(Gln) amidotransferase A subunit family amidase